MYANTPPSPGNWDYRVWQSEEHEDVWTVAFHDPSTATQTDSFPVQLGTREQALQWSLRQLNLTPEAFGAEEFLRTGNSSGKVSSDVAGQLALDLHFAGRLEGSEGSPWFYGSASPNAYAVITEAMLRQAIRERELEANVMWADAALHGDRGHVFVVRGDLRRMRADGFLLPTDGRGRIGSAWQWLLPSADGRLTQEQFTTFLAEGAVAIATDKHRVIVAETAHRKSTGVNEYCAAMGRGLRAALEAFASGLDSAAPGVTPRLLMPLLGTGRGGLAQNRGLAARHVLETLDDFLNNWQDRAFDVVVVCHTPSDYAALQALRRTREAESPPNSWRKPEWLQQVISSAQRGQLGVLFGAGASAGLGLPNWPTLLVELAGDFGVQAEIRTLDPIDAASILIDAAGSEEAFRGALANRLGTTQTSLVHALIASLAPRVAITTNYDRAYENAIEALGQSCAVLPWQQPTHPGQPTLLKLHGDVLHGSVVLSRDHFVLMHSHRRPLGSMVQERMIVGHLLVIGSSMSDPTLVQAAEEVASLIRSSLHTDSGATPNSGTVLLTREDAARHLLLERSFKVEAAEQADGSWEQAGRRVEILLDYICMHSEQSLAFTLDAAYDDLLADEPTRALAEQLRAINRLANDDLQTTPLGRDLQQRIQSALETL